MKEMYKATFNLNNRSVVSTTKVLLWFIQYYTVSRITL